MLIQNNTFAYLAAKGNKPGGKTCVGTKVALEIKMHASSVWAGMVEQFIMISLSVDDVFDG
jgi:hypothetical protein